MVVFSLSLRLSLNEEGIIEPFFFYVYWNTAILIDKYLYCQNRDQQYLTVFQYMLSSLVSNFSRNLSFLKPDSEPLCKVLRKFCVCSFE